MISRSVALFDPASSGLPPFFRSVVSFRSFWFILALIAINTIIPVGTPLIFPAAAAIIGVYGASRLAHSRLNTRGFAALLAASWLLLSAIFWALGLIPAGSAGAFLLTDRIKLHADTCLLVASFSAAATWLFWRVRGAAIVEIFAFIAAALTTLAAHRNFRLDQPKIINSIAWRLGIDHITMLLLIGSALLVASGAYLFVASKATRPLNDESSIQWAPLRSGWFLPFALLLSTAAIVFLVQRIVYNHFHGMMLARVANGVGMSSEPGVSPLSFQSALGSTNQPAALMRLEGDYVENPFTPMMYLRESALSGFNGREMIFAGRAFDTDLPAIKPQDSFTGKEDAELSYRTPVTQSFYLLADHDNAFALDYPLSIVQLKNPKPGRFKSTYRTYSQAPAFNRNEIASTQVGDPRWSDDVRNHYLVTHPDKRYEELARTITNDTQSPVEKILTITDYLNRTAIYTLTPNHTTGPNDDPVAPFLFGDHRGYCVHFAHAITYMLRSLGIPARIGTGYLTDLSQAKDGHVLLRMSDRHAWAEAYLTGLGWIPFDVQPEQVESHADTQVDAKLLEELMGILEPGEELLPSESIKDEAGFVDEGEDWMPKMRYGLFVIYGLIALTVLTKIFVLFGWRIAPTPALKLRLGYLSLTSQLYDVGISRSFGETRSDLAARAPHGALKAITPLVLSSIYSKDNSATLSSATTKESIIDAQRKLKLLPRWKRFLGLLNPASVFSLLGGRRW